MSASPLSSESASASAPDVNAPRVGAGALSGFAALAAGVVATLITTPVVLRALGQARFGLWIALVAAVSFTGLLDFGFGQAVARFSGEHRARHDPKAVEAFIIATGAAYLVAFGLVLLAALPQLLLRGADPEAVRRFLYSQPTLLFPWFAAGRLALGIDTIRSLCIVFVWTAAAYAFARWQFERSLRFDVTEIQAKDTLQSDRVGLLERLFRMFPRLLRDPLGALVEKEIRLLTRSA